MQPETFLGGRVTLHCGDSREVLRALPDASIHAVCCDPPYALDSIRKRFGGAGATPAQHGRDGLYARASAGFMGQAWDTGETAFDPAFWAEVCRVLKPGGHVVAFGGTRTFHRLTCAIEDAGFEIRDTVLELAALDPIVGAFVGSLSEAQLSAFLRVCDLLGFQGLMAWVYGSGFPKSHDVAKGIDRLNGDERPVIGRERIGNDIRGGALLDVAHGGVRPAYERDITAAASAASAAWEGWGTALKPAWEPIVLARKPLAGTVAESVLEHGTGALNIDGCRVEAAAGDAPMTADHVPGCRSREQYRMGVPINSRSSDQGRWPANVVHDGSAEVVEAFPAAPGQLYAVTGSEPSVPFATVYGDMRRCGDGARPRGDQGSAARFFYGAKADAGDRIGSKHPTVKPIDLMQWLCRLVTPPGGVVLDPFAGTGTTGEAAWREGFSAILIEREAEYQADIRRRLALCLAGPAERARESAKARGRVDAPLPLFSPTFTGDAAE